MYDILKEKLDVFSSRSLQDQILEEIKLSSDEFALLTLHRRENVDVAEKLGNIMEGFARVEHAIVWPMHPRTRKRLLEQGLEMSDNLVVIPPVSYTRMMALVSRSSLLLTDSGGLQKEAYLLNTPCVTIRDTSEWVETFEAKANVLTSPDPAEIEKNASMMWGKNLNNDPAVYGDGHASQKIARLLVSGQITIKRPSMTK